MEICLIASTLKNGSVEILYLHKHAVNWIEKIILRQVYMHGFNERVSSTKMCI